MPVSSEIEMIFNELKRRQSPDGSLYLTPVTVQLVGTVLFETIRLAKQLEANVARPEPVLVDMSDPKIERFPTPKQPVGVIPPEDGGAA